MMGDREDEDNLINDSVHEGVRETGYHLATDMAANKRC